MTGLNTSRRVKNRIGLAPRTALEMKLKRINLKIEVDIFRIFFLWIASELYKLNVDLNAEIKSRV